MSSTVSSNGDTARGLKEWLAKSAVARAMHPVVGPAARRVVGNLLFPRWGRPEQHSLADVIVRVDAAMSEQPEPFFRTVDRARDDYLRRNPQLPLEDKLFLVKVLNVLVIKYEYTNYHAKLLGRPVGFMLDPFNGCNLRCPSCHNSGNQAYRTTLHDFPPGVMKPGTYDAFIGSVGLTALNGHFYNKSEPFLNRSTPGFIREAATRRVRTMTSSSLSIPKLDVEQIVESGLEELLVAIDGAEQSAYEIYRKRGDLKLVLDNMRRLVEARNRKGRDFPWIRWQYLTFAHNIDQTEDAIELARETGVDEISIGTPCSVDADEPDLQIAIHPLSKEAGAAGTIRFRERPTMRFDFPLDGIADEIEEELVSSHVARFEALGDEGQVRPRRKRERVWCDWPYFSVIIDAHGSFVPCDRNLPSDGGRVEFAKGDVRGRLDFNDDDFRLARLKWINRERFEEETRDLTEEENILCNSCEHPVPSQTGFGAARGYLQERAVRGELDPECYPILTEWNRTEDRHCQLYGPVERPM
jgi:MoaA/NifB/PqqE/SkfB family radical SAM enzyme